MDETVARRRALALWEEGQRQQAQGEIDEAIATYTRSIEVFPTAEAFTFRGWAKSFQGNIDAAIEDCHRAIQVDPGYGNPYNDIGCYLLQKGDLDEAIPWLEKAKTSPRYEPRHFPFMNLGRVYAAKGRLYEAVHEFEAALEIAPGDEACLKALGRIRGKLN